MVYIVNFNFIYQFENILLLCAVSLAIKLIFLMLLFGKSARNLKFLVLSISAFLCSSFSFILLAYVLVEYAFWLIFSIYFLTPYIYLLFVALIYLASSILTEFTIFYLFVLKGKIGKGDLIASLMLINLFSYIFLYELGLLSPFLGV